MTDPIVSHKAFIAIITACTALGVFWVLIDLYLITTLRGKDMKDPTNRDKRFGYTIGIMIGAFVTLGILRFHGVA